MNSTVAVSKQEEEKRLLRAKKRTAPALALNTTPGKKRNIAGKNFVFSGSLFMFTTMAFVAGYLDSYTVGKYEIYVTMVTGNLVKAVTSICNGDYSAFILCVLMTLGTTIVGGHFASYAAELTYPSRSRCFFLITSMSLVSIVVCEVCAHFQPYGYQYSILSLSVCSGALLNWSMKMGYAHALYTTNVLRMTEALYKLIYNIGQGGAKLRGDLVIVTSMLFSFIAGSFSMQAMYYYNRNFSLYPIIIVFSLQNMYSFGFFFVEALPPIEKTPPPPPIRVSVTEKIRQSISKNTVPSVNTVLGTANIADATQLNNIFSIQELEDMIAEEEEEDEFEEPDYLNPDKVTMVDFLPAELDEIRETIVKERVSIRFSRLEARRSSMMQNPSLRQSSTMFVPPRSSVLNPVRHLSISQNINNTLHSSEESGL